MAFEHSTEDQVPHRAVREPRDLDEHDRARRFVLTEVGEPTAGVDVEDDVELFAQIPERLVDGIPQRRDRGVGRDAREHDAAEDVDVLLRPPDLGERVVEIVEEHLRDTARRPGAAAQKSASQRLCACTPAKRRS